MSSGDTTLENNLYLWTVFEAIIYCFIFNLKKMKKLVLFFAVAFAMSFAACSSKTTSDASSADSTMVDSISVVEETVIVDSVAADSAAIVDSAAVVAE